MAVKKKTKDPESPLSPVDQIKAYLSDDAHKDDHYNFEEDHDYIVSSGSLTLDLEMSGGIRPSRPGPPWHNAPHWDSQRAPGGCKRFLLNLREPGGVPRNEVPGNLGTFSSFLAHLVGFLMVSSPF